MDMTTIPDWTLGDRLTKARSLTGLSRTRFASVLGISEASVKRYELDDIEPKRGIILGWAVACNVDPDWLENGPGKEGVTDPLIVWKTHNCVGQLTLLVAA